MASSVMRLSSTKHTNLVLTSAKKRPVMLSYDESVQYLPGGANNPQQNLTISNLKTSYSKNRPNYHNQSTDFDMLAGLRTQLIVAAEDDKIVLGEDSSAAKITPIHQHKKPSNGRNHYSTNNHSKHMSQTVINQHYAS